jgi:hypothetical protein
LVYINGKPQLRKASGRVVLTPQMRIRDVAEPVRTIPLNAIKPVLESGYVVDSETDFDSLPRIVDLSSERLILGDKSSIAKYGAQRQLAGNEQRVFIRGDVTPRGVYDIIRPAEQLKAADSNEVLGQAVIIDRGQANGVTRGDVFALSRDGRRINDPQDQTKLQLPEESVGLAMVYKSFDQVSYALLMESHRGIQIGDHLRQP